MSERERLLREYAAAVQFPEAGPAEVLALLRLRSSLAVWEPELTDAEQERLADADDMLLRHAARFYETVAAAAAWEAARHEFNPPNTHWWWQLERLPG
jgi:hypothetical protein